MPILPRCKYCDERLAPAQGHNPEIQDHFCSCECEMLYLGEMIMEEFICCELPPFDPPYTYQSQLYIQ